MNYSAITGISFQWHGPDMVLMKGYHQSSFPLLLSAVLLSSWLYKLRWFRCLRIEQGNMQTTCSNISPNVDILISTVLSNSFTIGSSDKVCRRMHWLEGDTVLGYELRATTPSAGPQTHYNRPHATASGLIWQHCIYTSFMKQSDKGWHQQFRENFYTKPV